MSKFKDTPNTAANVKVRAGKLVFSSLMQMFDKLPSMDQAAIRYKKG
jgi:hypothetical protein